MTERLLDICQKTLIEKGFDNEIYNKRLKHEMQEIDSKNKHEYFLDLYDRKVRYPRNPNNLLVAYLLGLVKSVDINNTPEYEYGDAPDIDSDYMPQIQYILKNEWAPKTFGKDKVCNIGSYNKFGLKSSLIDMAKVHDKDRNEILELTKPLSSKDDEGDALTWEKAMELYPKLKAYCDANPDLAEAARRLVGRVRGMGKHAGGLIISSVPLDRFVPLVLDSDGNPLSAWPEGLSDQDLGPVGLIKFDLLVVTNLTQLAIATDMVKKRHGLDSICALPGQKDWSDLRFLNDPKAIAMADKAELKCIFQFDSYGIREMVRESGVTCFEDLATLSSLFRPGPMNSGLHTEFIQRKRGKKQYTLHPLLQPILGKTHGCLVFQESVIQILNKVGGIPMKDCESMRKAISKKKIDAFLKYKQMFLVNGQKNLGYTQEEIIILWDQIEKFSEYGFNKSHATAYGVLSSMLLYLKAHYPIEFFTAVLSCEEKEEKIKEYKIEAEKYGVKICRLDLNKSKAKFSIVKDDQDAVYIGFGHIKGIGETSAQKIVDGQPYKDFNDFLEKFGTDAVVIKPLLGLRIFNEDTPVNLYKYAEWYKDNKVRIRDRQKRFKESCDKFFAKIKEKLPFEYNEPIRYEVDFVDMLQAKITELQVDNAEILKLITKYRKSCVENLEKLEEDKKGNLSFKPEYIEIKPELELLFQSQEECEKAYYGFIWTHPLEKSPDYDERTFERLKNEDLLVGYVEVQILEANQTISKTAKKTVYYLLKAEDAHGEIGYIQVWEDDWARFGDWIVKDAFLRLKIQAPTNGFPRYTLYGPAKHLRRNLPKDRNYDFRVVIMRK